MAKNQSENRLLASLPAADFNLLRPHLKSLNFEQEHVLFHAGDAIHRVFFPHAGIISLVIDLGSGQTIEAAMTGRDSVVGASCALDGQIALNKGIVQVGGEMSVLDVLRLRTVAAESPAFRTTLIRHEQMLLVQAQQTAACNASHPTEARLARWLLRTSDLVDSDTLPLTQEFLAQMLGVRRSSVSIVARTLQEAGLIRYRRGRIQVVSREGLEKASCECYLAVRTLSERLLRIP